MICESCGIQIPVARLEAVPDAQYCVNCTDKHSSPIVARVIYSHKCDSELFIAEGKENVRRLSREWSRAR